MNCSVYGCNAVAKNNPELSFHKFPSPDQEIEYFDSFGLKTICNRKKLWETNLKMGKTATPWMNVCSLHFTKRDYSTRSNGI